MTEPDAAARRMRVVFMGTGEIGVPAFRWLLAAPGCEVVAAVSQPDKPAGRKLELRASAIKQLAVERGVPVLQPVRMRAPDAVAEIVALRADVRCHRCRLTEGCLALISNLFVRPWRRLRRLAE